MNGRDLMLAMGNIDDRYISEAEPVQKVSEKDQAGHSFTRGIKAAAVAASLIIAIATLTIFASSRWFEAGGNGFSFLGRPAGGGLHGAEQKGAVEHDRDRSQIIYQPVEAKVPAEFWFEIRLSGAQINKSDFLVKWDERAKFTKAALESGLGRAVKEPTLPAGDYTTAKSVLRDLQTEQIIAYQIDYIYFEPKTMDFLKSFRVFYFDADHFDPDRVTATHGVTLQDGLVRVDELVPPAAAYGKVPHVRSLLFISDGVGIAVEAETSPLITGKSIDQRKSLELYRETDQELAKMMGSLLK